MVVPQCIPRCIAAANPQVLERLLQIIGGDDQFGLNAPQPGTLQPYREDLVTGGVKRVYPAAIDLQPSSTGGIYLLQRGRQCVKVVLRHPCDRPVALQAGHGP